MTFQTGRPWRLRFRPKERGADLIGPVTVTFLVLMLLALTERLLHAARLEAERLPVAGLVGIPGEIPTVRLVLNVGYPRDARGKRTSDQPVLVFGAETIRVDDFDSRLITEMKQLDRRTPGTRPSDVMVVVQSEDDVPTGVVQAIVQSCQSQGFTRFSMRPLESQ